VQLYLNCPQIPLPLEGIWEQPNEDDRAAALETLAQLLAEAAMEETTQEKSHD
jgi:hypothetical protein